MAVLRLFASAREAAGTARDVFDVGTVDALLAAASLRYGPSFQLVLPSCRVWLNGDPADGHESIGPTDEVAVLPPVSGGA